MADINRKQLYQQFQDEFPLETLKDMTLEKYTNLNRDDSFCYWVESKTTTLGSFWGGSSYKFGIYQYGKRPKESDKQVMSDDKYAWYRKYNKETSKDAYEVVHQAIVRVAELARDHNFAEIDDFKEILGEGFKWKIAFLYSNEALIPIYQRDMLEYVVEDLGMEDTKNKSIPEFQEFLLDRKGDKDLYEYYDELLVIVAKYNAKNNFNLIKQKVAERLEEDGRLVAIDAKKKRNYLWVGTPDGIIGNPNCHYELCADGDNKAPHKKGYVYVELHCESKHAYKFKELCELDGVHEFNWGEKNWGVRIDDNGWEIKSSMISKLAETLVDELYKLDDAVGDITKSIASELVLNNDDRRYWIYSPGKGGSEWDLCKENGIICINWPEVKDLNKYSSVDEVRDNLKEIYNKHDASFKNDGLALWQFCKEMKPGDIIYAKLGQKKLLGRGVITSEYIYDESYGDYSHIRKVEWTHIGLWDAPSLSVVKTLTDLTPYHEYVKKLEDLFKDNNMKQYWWLVANPKIWSIQAMATGTTVQYSIKNDKGKPRRIFQNFLDAKEGDAVVCYESTPVKKIVALAEVAKANDGTYISFKKTIPLQTPIDFTEFKDMPELADMQFLGNPQGTFFKLTEDEYNAIMDLTTDDNPVVFETKEFSPYNKARFLGEVFISPNDYDKLENLLLIKKNIILQGAPGVGKTFSAKRLAYSIIGQKDNSKIELVQFHQNYSYEDFIMGYKPTEEGGFKLKTGVFYNFCKKAASDPDNKYFFIIDEINRGNLSKILGELMMLIENGYRGEKNAMKLAYSEEFFYVPENIYIIGMMNTADRSLAMIDYALRRRFSFFEMKPGFESAGFKQYQKSLNNESFDKVIEGIIDLNKKIVSDSSLGEGFQIGHSYFCEQKSIETIWLRNVIEYDIIPMLREYWFDNDDKFKEEAEKLKKLVE